MHQSTTPLAGTDSVCHKRGQVPAVCMPIPPRRTDIFILHRRTDIFIPHQRTSPSQVRRHCFLCPSQHDFICPQLAIHSPRCSPRLERFPGPGAPGWVLEHMPRLSLTADPAADWASFVVRCYQTKCPSKRPSFVRFSSPPPGICSL